ncbi:MAG: polyprenyl synthetase family protein [Streptomycetaceae bacterium]|nr:polyprenyl synthetase family protein [Streptomycetaceae bacterium]
MTDIFVTDREGHEAAGILARSRLAVEPALRLAIQTLPHAMQHIAAYHFGWQNADGSPVDGSAGKAIRPALVLAATQALGGSREQAVPAAAAVELVHNFTLLHDDIIDHDPTRRHRPTVWTVFGTSNAILAGDAMQALAVRILTEDAHPRAADAAARLSKCVVELCEGQHSDCAFERRSDVSLDECLAMAEAKTGALLGCACALGAVYAEANEEAVEAMDAFGRQIGLAFQLIDDLIGIWGDTSVTGKPVGADLAARKKSLPVVAALRSATPAALELAGIYGGERPLESDEVCRAANAVELAGGRDWAQIQACERMADAIGHLSRAVPDGHAAGDLLALAELATRRNR